MGNLCLTTIGLSTIHRYISMTDIGLADLIVVNIGWRHRSVCTHCCEWRRQTPCTLLWQTINCDRHQMFRLFNVLHDDICHPMLRAISWLMPRAALWRDKSTVWCDVTEYCLKMFTGIALLAADALYIDSWWQCHVSSVSQGVLTDSISVRARNEEKVLVWPFPPLFPSTLDPFLLPLSSFPFPDILSPPLPLEVVQVDRLKSS